MTYRYSAPGLDINVIPNVLAISSLEGTTQKPERIGLNLRAVFCNTMQYDWECMNKWSAFDPINEFEEHLLKCVSAYKEYLKSKCFRLLKSRISPQKKYNNFIKVRAASLERMRKRLIAFPDGTHIFQSDPDSIKKLHQKLINIRQAHSLMLKANRIIKSDDSEAVDIKKANLRSLGLSEERVSSLLIANELGQKGFSLFLIKNTEKLLSEVQSKLDAQCGMASAVQSVY